VCTWSFSREFCERVLWAVAQSRHLERDWLHVGGAPIVVPCLVQGHVDVSAAAAHHEDSGWRHLASAPFTSAM
jgi:hypothetical protein